jgi:aryl-alcohol dehydrogenase-like predicted oxidoreductase
MKYGNVKGVEKPISRLVLGTMIINNGDLRKSFDLLDAVFELGGTALDTAHVYGSEEPIGLWMKERGNRDKVVILDKGAHPSNRPRVTPADITSDLSDSLARLKTDYIDVYMLHRDDPDVPVGPIVEVLNEHLSAGRIHAFGGSNWKYERIQEANEFAEAHGLVPFSASSPNYGLAE